MGFDARDGVIIFLDHNKELMSCEAITIRSMLLAENRKDNLYSGKFVECISLIRDDDFIN